MKKINIVLLAVLITTLILTACVSGTIPSGGGNLDGAALMQQRCSVCHTLDRVVTSHKTLDQWNITVERMISNGAQLTPQEEQTLVNYLAQTYP